MNIPETNFSMNIFSSAAEGIQKGLDKGAEKGFEGWDNPLECTNEQLQFYLEKCLNEDDYQGVLTYAAMIYHRKTELNI
jgi:hypothetical protein